MKVLPVFIWTLFILSALSCSKDETPQFDEAKQLSIDIDLIEDYLKANNLTAEKTTEGIYYIVEVPGGETKPTLSNTVVVNYKGYFLDKSTFDAANNIKFGLKQVIKGWQIGIPKFGKGGRGILLIPSKYGYGSSPFASVGPNKVLIFDVELLDIK